MTGWSAPSWFETAYLSPSEWKGSWISGPARTPMPLTNAQAAADDACCIQGNTTLFTAASARRPRSCASPASPGSPRARPITLGDDAETATLESVGTPPGNTTTVLAASAGDTNLKVASVTNFAAGAPLTIGTQTVTITTVGTAAGAATTLFAPTAAGDTNVKTTSVNGFTAGQPALIDGEIRTVTTVGTQGRATTLAAAAAAGDTNVKVASVTGFGVGDTLIVGTESQDDLGRRHRGRDRDRRDAHAARSRPPPRTAPPCACSAPASRSPRR